MLLLLLVSSTVSASLSLAELLLIAKSLSQSLSSVTSNNTGSWFVGIFSQACAGFAGPGMPACLLGRSPGMPACIVV